MSLQLLESVLSSGRYIIPSTGAAAATNPLPHRWAPRLYFNFYKLTTVTLQPFLSHFIVCLFNGDVGSTGKDCWSLFLLNARTVQTSLRVLTLSPSYTFLIMRCKASDTLNNRFAPLLAKAESTCTPVFSGFTPLVEWAGMERQRRTCFHNLTLWRSTWSAHARWVRAGTVEVCCSGHDSSKKGGKAIKIRFIIVRARHSK